MEFLIFRVQLNIDFNLQMLLMEMPGKIARHRHAQNMHHTGAVLHLKMSYFFTVLEHKNKNVHFLRLKWKKMSTWNSATTFFLFIKMSVDDDKIKERPAWRLHRLFQIWPVGGTVALRGLRSTDRGCRLFHSLWVRKIYSQWWPKPRELGDI